jgi:hypothetical protein
MLRLLLDGDAVEGRGDFAFGRRGIGDIEVRPGLFDFSAGDVEFELADRFEIGQSLVDRRGLLRLGLDRFRPRHLRPLRGALEFDQQNIPHKLVSETPGIKHLHAIIGVSMGGMNAWQWAVAHPDAMDGIMPVVAFPAKVSGRNLLRRRMVVKAIESAPDWNGGNDVNQPRSLAEGYGVLQLMIGDMAVIGKLRRVADVRFDHRRGPTIARPNV